MEVNQIIQGDSLTILKQLPDEIVNCCVTSPPYWNLRDYSVEGQLGLEKTFEEYITKLCNIFDEVKRVLRKDGTCWVNIGDSYGGIQGKNAGWPDSKTKADVPQFLKPEQYSKSLLDIPYRFSIEMINRGWIKRNTIIWKKPNCMPSSANDKFTVDFEYLFFFTKNNDVVFWTNEKTGACVGKQPLGTMGVEGIDWEWIPCPRCQGTGGETKIEEKEAEKMGSPRARYHRITKQEDCKRCKGLGKVKSSFWTGHDYWFEQQFENHTSKDDLDRRTNKFWSNNIADGGTGKQNKGRDRREFYGEQGRNKRCVWTIPTHSFPEAHFATFPEALIETPIQAGCPRYVCKKCGKGREKIYQTTKMPEWDKTHKNNAIYKLGKTSALEIGGTKYNEWKSENPDKFIGYSDCGCNAGWEGGVVLDPFMGAGTTAVMAKKQGKKYIGIELKQEYIDMANKRIRKIPETLF